MNKKDTNDYPTIIDEILKKKKHITLKNSANELAFVDGIDELNENKKPQTPSQKKQFDNYNPDVIDFIRRCDTNEQALEIIIFLEKKGELSIEKATALKAQLQSAGLRSFGSKKKDGYYFNADED